MPEDSKVKWTQSAIDIIKNAVLILVIGYAFFWGRPALKTTLNDIVNGNSYVTEATVGDKGVTIKLARATKELGDALAASSKTEGKKDQLPSPQGMEILKALEASKAVLARLQSQDNSTAPAARPKAEQPSTQEIWVYLGILRDGRWDPNSFGLTSPPNKGQSARAATDVYERDSKPLYVDAIKDWKLGNVIGIVRQGTQVQVQDLDSIESDAGGMNWWAKVKVG